VILEVSPDSAPIVHVVATTVLYLHIGAGLISLMAGVGALSARKGSRLHRVYGNVFVVAMLTMASIGAAVSPFLNPPQWVNVVAGTFTVYLVVTAWMTARLPSPDRRVAALTFAVAVAIALGAVAIGWATMNDPHGKNAGGAFVFAAIMSLAATGDFRVMLGRELSRVQRTVRHLWRMCFALLIAAASLFLGQPQLFPETARGLRFVPVLAVVLAMLGWIVRVRKKRGSMVFSADVARRV
jgi:uncharacterized membrane protein